MEEIILNGKTYVLKEERVEEDDKMIYTANKD